MLPIPLVAQSSPSPSADLLVHTIFSAWRERQACLGTAHQSSGADVHCLPYDGGSASAHLPRVIWPGQQPEVGSQIRQTQHDSQHLACFSSRG